MEAEYVRVGGRLVSLSSDEGKELMRWEQPHYNPHDPRNQFPKMLYKAQRRADGVMSVGEAEDGLCGGQPGAAEAFTRQCQITVGDSKLSIEQNQKLLAEALERGWRETQGEAKELLNVKEIKRAEATAHRHHDDQHLSEAAKAEAKAADDASFEHVPEVPEKKRGRRKRAA